MKIVDRKTFMALPPETLYSKYQPCAFEGLMIKGDTIQSHEGEAIDWFYQDIGAEAIESRDSGDWANRLEMSEETGCDLQMNYEMQGRDGCFEDNQLFAVLSKQDVAQLIERLKRCL